LTFVVRMHAQAWRETEETATLPSQLVIERD
jgi:hypothetical protein